MLKKIFTSRTILVLFFLVIFNAVQAVSDAIEPTTYAIINSVLVTLAGYFRINTKVDFK